MQEIERKFLLGAEAPVPDVARRIHLEQGYLAVEADGTEVRLRADGGVRLLGVKRGRGESRHETEVEVTAQQFERLWPLTEGRRIAKTRVEWTLQETTYSLDVYGGPLEGLATVEVEFRSQEDARAFEPPSWFGRELTGDRRFANQTLATATQPPDVTGSGAQA